MRFPKMILFDYGHTLLYEPDRNAARGNAALLEHVTSNPNKCTINDVLKAVELVYGTHLESIRGIGYDIGAQTGNRLLYEYLGIEFSLTPLEMETVFWNGASAGAIMPGADAMLDYINKRGIRSAVISNLLWSGAALTQRLNRLLPRNRFEFVMTSSDYLIRKPGRLLFDTALQKAGLSANDVWYCGDNPIADIEGASGAGIYPVWYRNDTDRVRKDYTADTEPNCEHLCIREWQDMVDALEGMSM